MSVFNEARKETWSEIQGLSDDVINTKPGKDEWSIQEVLDHLKKIDLKTAQLFKENIRSAPLKAIQAKPVEASENRYDKRKAPDFLEPERKTKYCLTIKTELDHARQQLTSIIASFHKADFQRVLPHPIFLELTVEQWIDFIGHHEKRHIKQIQDIKRKLSS